MKNRYKLLILSIVVFSIMILSGFNNVFAYGIAYSAWRQDVDKDGKPDLLFRRYSEASGAMIEDYAKAKANGIIFKPNSNIPYTYKYNGVNLKSRWVYIEQKGVYKPLETEYSTVGYTFHTSQGGKYELAYDETCIVANPSQYSTTQYFEHMPLYLDNTYTIDLKPVMDETTQSGKINSSILELMCVNSVIQDSGWGTGINMRAISPKNRVVYRYAIVEYEGENIFVEDRVIYHDDLKALRAAMKKNADKITNNMLFISDIVISNAKYDNGGYEVAKTASQFFSQYKKYGYTNDFWPTSITGTKINASRAVINVFDNIIQLPQTSKKHIVVRHTNLGQEAVLSKTTFNNGTRLFNSSGTITVKTSENGETIAILPNGGSGMLEENGYKCYVEESYLGTVDVHNYIEKAALTSKACLGYNVSAAPSFKEAFQAIGRKIQNGKYTEGSTVKLDGLVEESEAECVVIDFYYTEAIDVIYVNHLYIDKNDVVLPISKQSIVPNTTAYIGAPKYDIELKAIKPTYESLGNNEYVLTPIQEQYYRKKHQKIYVTTAYSLLTESFKFLDGKIYKGYDVSGVYTPYEKLVGKKVYPQKDWDSPFTIAPGVEVQNNVKQVNFYYYNRDKDEVAIPKKLTDIDYFLSAKVNNKEYKGYCYNEQGERIMSVPSGSNVKQGLVNVPTVMVSAINLEEVKPVFNTHMVNVIASYRCGLDIVTFNRIIGYNFGYYKVTELIADGLDKITLYDDKNNRMFTQAEKVYNYDYDKKSNMGLELYGANAISTDDIDDWKNYVDITVSDKYNSVKLNNQKFLANLNHTFLTVGELATVDANLDGKVTDGVLGDITAVNVANSALKGVMETAKFAKNAAEAVYNGAKKVRDGAKAMVDNQHKIVEDVRNSKNILVVATLPIHLAAEAAAFAVYLPTVAVAEAAHVAFLAAEKAYDIANLAYLAHCAYKETLDNNWKNYKTKYDEFAAIKDGAYLGPFIKSDSGLAKAANLSMKIVTYNMHLKLNGEELNKKATNTYDANLSEYMKFTFEDGFVTTIDAPEMKFYQKIYNGVGKTIKESDYSYDSKINDNAINGTRTLKGEVKYTTHVLLGKKFLVWNISNIGNIEDNVYYSDYIDKKQNITGKFTIDYYGLISKVGLKANVYTPIKVNASLSSNSNVIVDQRNDKSTAQTIQLTVPFTVTFSANDTMKDKVYGISDMTPFVKGYYIKFNFDVDKVKINGATYNEGKVIKAGTWIGMIGNNGSPKLEASIYADVKDDTIDIANEGSSSYEVRAVTTNSSSFMREEVKKFSTLNEIMEVRNNLKPLVTNICTDKTTTKVTSVPSYFAEAKYDVFVLNRLYDFKITDIKDLAWKSVFRSTAGAVVNAHTGKVYYSGIYKWLLDGLDGDNYRMYKRTPGEIGSYPLRTLPLAAYKHTDSKYVKAPKLGYTFSYDMKVTGNYYDNNTNKPLDKTIEINTKFYYISDDGKTFIEEGKGGIYLFYRNEKGQYVRINETNGGNYNLSFVPNEGYRYITDKEKFTLSNKSESLGNLRQVILKPNMATVAQTYSTSYAANNGTVITYYGEYKLPNSTIAVKVDNAGNYDINQPLKNGYIGVIFDITAKAGKNGNNSAVSLSYNQNTKNTPNTSQWDYEGYLGFTTPGQKVPSGNKLTMKLEGGTWYIDDATYNKIKGTVILYDIDEKASTDYE